MKKKRKQWTQQEKQLLRKIYPTYSWDELINIFQTSKGSIIHKAKHLGVKREMVNFAKWTQKDTKYLKENYGKINTKIIAENLNRSTSAIIFKANSLGLKTREYWTEEEIELLKEVFPKYGNQELIELYFNHRSVAGIAGMARKLNLLKEDLPQQKQKQFTKKQLLEDIKKVYKKLGRTPLLIELRLYGLPSERTLLRYFPQGYKGLCKELGWEENKNMFGRQGIFYSKNNDLCYSKAEVVITNFLIDNNIFYRKDESYYKDIYGIEEFGTKRTDWILEDNASLEYFGFWGRFDYTEQAQSKIDLCKKYNIKLIPIFPENFKDLKKILKDYIK